MRGAFALLAQTLVAAGFRLRRRSNPWRAAAAWWMVHSSLADFGCLAVLRWLLGKEGKSLGDLLDLDRSQVRQDLKRGVVDMVALAVGAGVSSALQRPFYPFGLPPQVTIVRVPRWALVYGTLVWPPLWVTTEEMVYLGYVLPRLEVQLGSTSLAAALVIAGWGPVQHPTLPALPDRRYLAFRSLTTLPIVGSQTVLYLRNGRRLPPLVFGHWVADLVTGLTVAFQPQEK
jgi:membrane protease YdiL (CAAX protease family)